MTDIKVFDRIERLPGARVPAAGIGEKAIALKGAPRPVKDNGQMLPGAVIQNVARGGLTVALTSGADKVHQDLSLLAAIC